MHVGKNKTLHNITRDQEWQVRCCEHWTGVNLKYDATDQGAFVFALQSAWRASTQHSMFTSFKTSNQAKNSPSVQCRNASFNSAVVPFVRSSSKRVFLQHFAFKRIAQQKEAQLKKPQRMANDEKSISRYYWSKNYFLFFFKTTFSLKKGSELNIKNIFSSSSNAIDGMKHSASACFLFSI